MGSIQQFQIPANVEKDLVADVGQIIAIGGDNLTDFYLFFPDLPYGRQWVQPRTAGFLFPLSEPRRSVRVFTDSAPSSQAPGPTTSTLSAFITAYRQPPPGQPSEFFLYSPGYPVPTLRNTAFPLISRPGPATYTFNVPRTSARGIIVYIKTTGITGTLTVSIWDFNDLTSEVGQAFILQSTALGPMTTLNALRIYPGIAVQANANANTVIGQTPQIQAVSTQVDTWQVDYDLIP